MLSIEIQQEGNFLVLKRDGEFVGKAALPYKDCDPTKPRSVIDGVALPWGSTTWKPNPCQWNKENVPDVYKLLDFYIGTGQPYNPNDILPLKTELFLNFGQDLGQGLGWGQVLYMWGVHLG